MANIDKQLIQTRFARSVATYHEAAKIQRDMAETLLDQLALATGGERRFDRILEAGCGSGMLTDLVEARLEYRKLYLIDLVPEWERFHRGRRAAEFRAADIETMPLPEHLSLVIANAVFQWVEDLASLLIRFHSALETGGILAFTTFGPENLREIAALTGRGLSYRALAGLHELLTPGFDIIACHEELITLEFATVRDILRHLKATGVTASGGRSRWTRSTLAAFEADYSARFRSGNRMLPLTYHPITLIARKRPEL